jgi:sigma-E factor negative regulatory protein RseA
MDTDKKNRELISALMDGALPDGDLELALAALGSPAGEEAWAVYHRIGDLLRAVPRPASPLSAGFAGRLAARLADEAPPGRAATPIAEPPDDAPAPRSAQLPDLQS